jgi:hypothetical protein
MAAMGEQGRKASAGEGNPSWGAAQGKTGVGSLAGREHATQMSTGDGEREGAGKLAGHHRSGQSRARGDGRLSAASEEHG